MFKTLTAAVASAALVLSLGASASGDDSARAKGWDRTAPADDSTSKTAKPVVFGGVHTWGCGQARAHVWAYQPDGAEDTARGTKYRVVKFNPYSQRKHFVASGHIKSDDEDLVRVQFPKAHGERYIQIRSRGELVESQRIRIPWWC